MSLSAELQRLLTAIAHVNGHSNPEEWAQAVAEKHNALETAEAPAEPEKKEGE